MSPTISFLFFTRKKSKENLLFNEFLDPPRALPSCVRERESWMNGPPARPRPRWPYSFPYIALVQEPPYIYISAGRDLFFFRQQKRAGDLHGCREKMLVLVFIHSLHAYYACPSSVCQKAKHFFFLFSFLLVLLCIKIPIRPDGTDIIADTLFLLNNRTAYFFFFFPFSKEPNT